MINPNTLKPFGKFCVTLGMIPSSYKASLTYEEQLLWFCNYLETKVIPAINNNAEALQEVQALYEEMRQFVVDYFSKLDVQAEIDNKLDEMVEDGTLANIINQQIFDELNKKVENEVKYHFIKTGNLKGDCILIQTKNKAFLNDLSSSTNYQDITNYLSLNNISHLDGIIISHFHNDHIGGTGAEAFIGLINSSFVNNTTQIYLPSTPDFTKFINDTSTSASDVVGRVTSMMNAVINSANSKGLTINYMSTNDTLEIDGAIIRFLNCSEEQYDNYYDVTETFDNVHYCTTYNNFSMVLEISNISNTTLLTGDIEKEAQSVLAPFINKNITLKKLEHHGLNRLSDANYLIKSNSNINVIMSTQEDNEMTTMRECLGYIFLTGKKLYSTLENSSICFIDTGHNVYSLSNLQEKLLDTMSVISGLTGINAGGLKNLNLASYKNSIKENDDLNDYVIPGDYCCYTSELSATINNRPSTSADYAFKLTVEQTSNTQRILQKIVFNINQYMEYVRYYYGEWTPWRRIKVDEKVQATFSDNIAIGDTDYHNIVFNNLAFGDLFTLDNSGNLICNKTGDYIINANVCVGGSNLAQGDRIVLRITKNNERAFLTQQDISANQQIVAISGFILHLSLNDVINLSYRNLTGSRGTVIAEQSFMSITS